MVNDFEARATIVCDGLTIDSTYCDITKTHMGALESAADERLQRLMREGLQKLLRFLPGVTILY